MSQWSRFNRIFLGTIGLLVGLLAGFVLWANPYRNIPGHPAADIPIMDVNQRYLYPSVVRDLRFDSAVFGTSTVRLLDPIDLDRHIGGKFAALAMNSATAWEQLQLARLFVEVRQREAQLPRAVIWGLDEVWCEVGTDYDRLTFRPFPPWMYDHNPWNDLVHLFNGKSVEISARIAEYRLGLKDNIRYQPNGYRNFLPPQSEYDLERVRQDLYGDASPSIQTTQSKMRLLNFSVHELFEQAMVVLPAETLKVLVFVPFHNVYLGAAGSWPHGRFDECKRRLASIARDINNVVILDYMRPSYITEDDTRYWDKLHYNVETASMMVRQIGEYLRDGTIDQQAFDILFDNIARP